jgi:ribose transport system substrate-binding protein
MKGKMIRSLAIVAVLATMVSCKPATGTSSAAASTGGTSSSVVTTKKEVSILIPSADHGWSGAVVTYAQEHAKTLNAEAGAKYNYVVYTSNNDEEQANKVDDLIAKKDSLAGIVINPYSNAAESSITKIANAKIPFSMFDRIITNDTVTAAANHISDVKGDNTSIGTVTAQKYISLGMTSADKVLVMPGDNSSVPESRTKGFTDALKAAGWTDAQIAANVVSTDYTGWSRDKAKELFTSWIGGDISGYKWIYTHDDEIFCGIFEALAGSTIADDKKATFKANIKAINGCGGLEEMFQIMRGDHPRSSTYNNLVASDCALMCATYDPAMINSAIDDMHDYLAGKSVTKDHVIASEIIDKSNLGTKIGFGGKVQ